MLSAGWIRKRQPLWARLDALLSACTRDGIRSLPHHELRELALLYRQAGADLSTARSDPSSAALARQLNELVGRAHNVLYTAAPAGRHPILRFYLQQFPQVFRQSWRYTAFAAALFLAGAAAGAALAATAPGFERFLLGGEMIDTIGRRTMWTHSILAMKPLASAGIMTNNLSVAFTAYAGGILAGLGTGYVTVLNGVLLGVIASACARAGMGLALWSFVAPHGALEIPAILIAAGAGFVLARGILAPGMLSRRDAVAEAGRVSVRLLLGVIPLLVIAGVIEAFVSPTLIAPGLKLLTGTAVLALLSLYLLAVGRATPVTEDYAP